MRPYRISGKEAAYYLCLFFVNDVLPNLFRRIQSAQNVSMDNHMVSIGGCAAHRLLSLFGPLALAAHRPCTDDLTLVLCEAAHDAECQVAFRRVVKLHVAKDDAASGGADGLANGLLMLNVAAVAADVGTDESVGAASLNIGERLLHPLAQQQKAAGNASVFILSNDGEAEREGLGTTHFRLAF